MSAIKCFNIFFLSIFIFTSCGCASLGTHQASSSASSKQLKKTDYTNGPEDDAEDTNSSSKMIAVTVVVIVLIGVAAYALAGYGLYTLGHAVGSHVKT